MSSYSQDSHDGEVSSATSARGFKWKRFVRYFLYGRALSVDDVERTFVDLHGEVEDVTDEVANAIREINEIIKNNFMRIDMVMCEVTGVHYYVLYSTFRRTGMTQFVGKYGEKQLEFLKTVINEIIMSDGSVLAETCLNVADSGTESMLKMFVADKFLIEIDEGKLALAPLLLSELKPYLRENYVNTISDCTVCKYIIVYGERCPSCNQKAHHHCIRRFRNFLQSFNCPSCHQCWKDPKINQNKSNVLMDSDSDTNED